MAIPEMTTVTLIKNHYDARMTGSFNPVAIPSLADSGIEFLNGGDNNLGIALQSFHKFICVVGTIYRTRFKSLVFRLGLSIEIMAVNYEHHFIHIIQF